MLLRMGLHRSMYFYLSPPMGGLKFCELASIMGLWNIFVNFSKNIN